MSSLLGPKPKTIEDFWTMITQEDVSTIVCLTNLKEGAKVSFIILRSIFTKLHEDDSADILHVN